jgi:hypothetical protein
MGAFEPCHRPAFPQETLGQRWRLRQLSKTFEGNPTSQYAIVGRNHDTDAAFAQALLDEIAAEEKRSRNEASYFQALKT